MGATDDTMRRAFKFIMIRRSYFIIRQDKTAYHKSHIANPAAVVITVIILFVKSGEIAS
jgi:hypothetical protein